MKTHFTSALVTSGLCILVSSCLWHLEIPELALVAAVALIGAILPDIDSDTSQPLQILFNILSLIVPVAAIYHFEVLRKTWQVCSMSWLIITAMVRWPIMWIFKRFTVHRGIFHSIPAALIWTGTIFQVTQPYLFQNMAQHEARWAVSLSAFTGYMVHLVLDEVCAVDFNGLRIKKSFGSALSLTAYDFRTSLMAYLWLALIGMSVYIDCGM